MVKKPSYLYNGNLYRDEMASLYWNGGQLILRKHPATSELQYKPYTIPLTDDHEGQFHHYFQVASFIIKKQNPIQWRMPLIHSQYTVSLAYKYMWCSADSRFAPSQWETTLLCNDVSRRLGARLESSQWCRALSKCLHPGLPQDILALCHTICDSILQCHISPKPVSTGWLTASYTNTKP